MFIQFEDNLAELFNFFFKLRFLSRYSDIPVNEIV